MGPNESDKQPVADPIALLRQHSCYISDEDDRRMNIRRDDLDDPFDNADLALRTCECGFAIDGFDEYHAHLMNVFEKAGYER